MTRRLTHGLGVTIEHSTNIPVDDIGWWESSTNIVTIRADATPEQRVWLLIQVWQMLVIGPSSLIGHPEPMLLLLPDPD